MITSLVSFRRGTGKTNIIANLAYRIALKGYKVGIADIDLHTPSAHVLFGLDEDDFSYFLNHYLCGECEIEQAVIDLREFFVPQTNGAHPPVDMGDVYLLAGSPSSETMRQTLDECFSVEGLVDSLLTFQDSYDLDYLLVDTHAGINEYVLAANSVSDLTLVVMHLDSQEYQGTAILIDLMRKLSEAQSAIVVSNPPKAYNEEGIKKSLEKSFKAPIAGFLPHSKEVLSLGSRSIFSMLNPNHPYTDAVDALVAYVIQTHNTDSV